jgi:hypothetical protein
MGLAIKRSPWQCTKVQQCKSETEALGGKYTCAVRHRSFASRRIIYLVGTVFFFIFPSSASNAGLRHVFGTALLVTNDNNKYIKDDFTAPMVREVS